MQSNQLKPKQFNRKKFTVICTFFVFMLAAQVFAQTGASGVRGYVGLINQSYHPGIVSYFEKAREELARRNENDVVKLIDIIIGGAFGSGFLYTADDGKTYVITNNHVVAQAHTLSITFENLDGTKKRIEGLKIVATDEDTDIALLALPEGVSLPVTQGLSLLERQIQEGEEVFSAGFPALGLTPVWQFGNGRVSNAAARFPKSINDETLIGPFIQHTAQIDYGNSGGPLLVAQSGAPGGYAVAGINTLSDIQRQAANYAIPVNRIEAFTNSTLNPKPETFRAALDTRLSDFVGGLGVNRSVYPHIVDFLSAVCVGENAEYAFEEMLEKANRNDIRYFIERCAEDFIGAMGVAVAWVIEDSVRTGTGELRASIKEVTGSNEEYTVFFTINNRDVSSVWIREYGNWRIKSFGTVAAGDRSLVETRQARRDAAERLRLNSDFRVEAGYAYLFKKAPTAFYASLEFSMLSVNFYYVNSDYWSLGVSGGFGVPIQAGNFGFIPFGRIGFAYSNDKEYKDYQDANWGVLGFPVSLMAQAGLKITSSYVPGLFIGANFQINFFHMHDDGFKNPMKMGFAVTAGYAF